MGRKLLRLVVNTVVRAGQVGKRISSPDSIARKRPIGRDVCVAMRQCLLPPSRRGFLQFTASRLPELIDSEATFKSERARQRCCDSLRKNKKV